MKNIFISSTFVDMQLERDILHERVIPVLNDYANNFGEAVSITDLRWGINTSSLDTEDGNTKILSFCFDSIDNCRPYKIILLGDRYGWTPNDNLVEKTFPFYNSANNNLSGYSATALEIEYGVFMRPDEIDNTLIYFRSIKGTPPAQYLSESLSHKQRLDSLKSKLRLIPNAKIKIYETEWSDSENTLLGLDLFAQMVISDVKELLDKEYKSQPSLTEHEQEAVTQWNLIQQKSEQCGARESDIEKLVKALNSSSLITLHGATGIGKSTVMSKLALHLKNEQNAVLPILCGYTQSTTTAFDVLKYIVNHLQYHCEEPTYLKSYAPKTLSDWKKCFFDLVNIYTNKHGQRLVIIIDAVDQLSSATGETPWEIIPDNLNSKCCMIVSCTDSFPVAPTSSIIDLGGLDNDSKTVATKRILGYHRKELDETVLSAIVSKRNSCNPLYLSLLIQRLLMMNYSDFSDISKKGGNSIAISQHQVQIIQETPETLDELCVHLIEIASRNIDADFVLQVLSYIALSKHGLRESDLKNLCIKKNKMWKSLDFSRLYLYLRCFFVTRQDGRYDFTHISIRNGIAKRISDRSEIHKDLLVHLDSLDIQDVVRKHEILYHAANANESNFFLSYINQHYHDEAIDDAAEEVKQLLCGQNANWIIQLLKNANVEAVIGDSILRHNIWADFINKKLSTFEVPRATVINLINENSALAKKIAVQEQTVDSVVSWCDSLKEYGDLFLNTNSITELLVAKDALMSSLNVLDNLLQEIKLTESTSMNSSLANFFVSVARCIYSIAKYDNRKESYLESQKWYDKGIDTLTQIPSHEQSDDCCYSLGLIFAFKAMIYKHLPQDANSSEEAVSNCLKSIKYLNMVSDLPKYEKPKKSRLMSAYIELGISYSLASSPNYNEAISALEKAIAIYESMQFAKHDSLHLEMKLNYSLALQQVAICYANHENNIDLAFVCGKKAFRSLSSIIEANNEEQYLTLCDIVFLLIQICAKLESEDSRDNLVCYANTLIDTIKTIINFSHSINNKITVVKILRGLYPYLTDWMSKDSLIAVLNTIVDTVEKIIIFQPHNFEVISIADSARFTLQELTTGVNESTNFHSDEGLKAYKIHDYENAHKHFMIAANEGDAKSQLNLGVMYANGEHVEKNLDTALQWFRKASENGINIADQYIQKLEYEKKQVDSQMFFKKAFEYYKSGDLAQAFECFSIAANAGHCGAQYCLGNMYDFGESVPVDDEKAFYWYKEAADQGHTDAQYNVAVLYEKGRGVERSLENACLYYSKAALSGNRSAHQAYLELCQYLGNQYNEMAFQFYEAKNGEKAVICFDKSAEYGNTNGWLNVGIMYLKGELVEKSISKAKEYLEKAAQRGNTQAKELIDNFCS